MTEEEIALTLMPRTKFTYTSSHSEEVYEVLCIAKDAQHPDERLMRVYKHIRSGTVWVKDIYSFLRTYRRKDGYSDNTVEDASGATGSGAEDGAEGT